MKLRIWFPLRLFGNTQNSRKKIKESVFLETDFMSVVFEEGILLHLNFGTGKIIAIQYLGLLRKRLLLRVLCLVNKYSPDTRDFTPYTLRHSPASLYVTKK